MCSKFSTPLLSHISADDLISVYEPAEDSFLLLDALEKDYNSLECLRPDICLEVGCGSGICITFLASILGPTASYWCTDINPKAASLAVKTASENNVNILPVITNLVDGIENRLAGKVDIILFNPPYVVTPSEEVGSNGIEAAWAGGNHGREVIDKFLPKIHTLLSKKGVMYMIVIKENKPDEIQKIMNSYNMAMETVMSRRTGPELLSVLKFQRLPT